MAILNQQQLGYSTPNGPVQYPFQTNNLISNTPYQNYMAPPRPIVQQPQQYLKCRPVSSKDEARAFQIDLDGSLWVFTDVGNERIYTKQINNDGTASFKTYVFQEETPYSAPEYVTKDEFNRVVQALMAAMQPQQGQISAQNNNKEQEKKTTAPIIFD